jgi:hypothetical protein
MLCTQPLTTHASCPPGCKHQPTTRQTFSEPPTASSHPLQVIGEVFSREHQLIRADPRRSTYLACGLLARGPISIADLHRNIARIRPSLRMAHWNTEVRSCYRVLYDSSSTLRGFHTLPAHHSMARIRPSLRMAHWNTEVCKHQLLMLHVLLSCPADGR